VTMQVGAKGMSNGVKMCQHANVSKFMYSFRLGRRYLSQTCGDFNNSQNSIS
jgi:hypothetical protein